MGPASAIAELIDKNAAKPLYLQVKDALLQVIDAKGIPPHRRIPSEREISEATGISRMTVRQAIRSLILEGRLYTVPGKGTFVAEPKIEQRLQHLTSFTEEMTRQGLRPGSQVVEAARLPASPHCARMLQVEPDTPLFYLARLRLANGTPVALERAWLSLERFPGLVEIDFSQRSLYDVLRNEYHVSLDHAVQFVEAAIADETLAALLQLPRNAPLLAFERVTYDPDDRPIEFVQSAYRSDRFRLSVSLDTLSETKNAVQRLVFTR